MSIPSFFPSQGFDNNDQGSLFSTNLLAGAFPQINSGQDVIVKNGSFFFAEDENIDGEEKNCVFMLLQDHFEQSQFEEIARSSAGGKKLKPNAIPTLFSFGEPPYPAVTSPFILLPMKAEAGLELNLPPSVSSQRPEDHQGKQLFRGMFQN